MVYSLNAAFITRQRPRDKQEKPAEQRLGAQEADNLKAHRGGVDDIKMVPKHIELILMILKELKGT
jgi:hypothetical protein